MDKFKMNQHSSILILFTIFLHGVQSQPVPTVNIPLTSYATIVGTTYTIPCSVTSSATTVTGVFWQRTINGVTSTITIDNVDFSGATVSDPSLTVITASISDIGTYTCFVTNSVGSGSDSTQLTVSGTVPTVNIPLTSYATNVGTTYTIPSSVTSSDTTVTGVFWQRTINGQTSTITINNVDFSGATTSDPSLTVISASISDSGYYTCFVSNSAGSGSDSTQLTVSGTVPTVNIPLTSYATTVGTTYTIPCSVTSSSTTVTGVFWQRTINGQTSTITINIVDFSGASVSDPSLNVISASISDSGTYTCFVTNSAGSGSDSTQFTVSGDIPTVTISQNAFSTNTGNNITLGCTVSANPNHTSVFWQRNVNGATQTITIDGVNYSGSSVNSPSLTVINANTGDSGTYTCFATNSVGTGQSSATTLTVTGNWCISED